MKRGYRYMSFLLIIAMIVGVLSSCDRKNDNRKDEDVQYYNSGTLRFETEDGMYYLDNDGFINFFDYESQENVIACNKPNCKHDEWDDNTPDEQKCNAYQKNIINGGFAENGKLYILVYDPTESITSLIRADLDCANQEVITELESDYTRYMVIKDGMMYLANSAHLYETDEEGLPVMSGKTYTWLYSVDLESGKTTELTERELDYNASYRIICVDDDSLYIARNYCEEYFDGTNYEEAKAHEELYEYNMATGEYKRIELEMGTGAVTYWYVYNGKVVEIARDSLADETRDFTLIDIETGDRTTVVSDTDSIEMFGEDIKYSLSDKHYLYDLETGEVEELNEEINSELAIFEVFNEYIFGQLGSNITGYGEKVLITREDYFNGEPNYIYILGDNGEIDVSIEKEEVIDEKAIVWKVFDYGDRFIEIWEEPLNKLLAEKGADYTVKIDAYGVESEDQAEADISIDLLEEMKNSSKRVDLITTDITGMHQIFSELIVEENRYHENVEFSATYEEAVSKGILISLDDYLASEKGQALKAAIMPECLERNKINGEVYGISQWMRTTSATAYNKELLEKYDIDVSKLSPNILENEAVLQKVWDGEHEAYTTFAAYSDSVSGGDLDKWFIDDDNMIAFDTETEKFINIYESEEFKSYVEDMYSLKDKGLMRGRNMSYDNFFAVPVTIRNHEIYEDTYTFYDKKGNEVETEVVVVPNVENNYVNMYSMDVVTGVASWSERTEDALDFLTRLYTDSDIANLIQYGIEGENYIIEDGKAVSQSYTRILEDGTEIPVSSIEWSFARFFTNTLITYPDAEMAEDKLAYMDVYFENEPEGLPVGFRFDGRPVNDELEALYNWYMETGDVPLFNMAADDIDAAIAEINADLKEAGVDTVIEEIQRQYDEWKAEQE